MKANQAFKANDEAVSPVIGVILMVAITVVLAAVVFVLVSNLSKNSNQSAPNISFNQDKAGKTLTIISADAADWKDITATVTGASTNTHVCAASVINTPGTARVTESAAHTATSGTMSAGKTIAAGDAITMIAGSLSGESCTLQLKYTPANQLLGTWTYTF
jgi:flagellin-like protein